VKRTSGDLVYRYGTVGGIPDKQIQNLLKVQLLKEKPDIEFARKYLKIHGLGENRYLCFFGIYAFQPEIFNCLDYLIKHHMRERDEYQLTSAMELLLKQNPDFHAYEIQGEFYDLGNPLSYVNAINAYSKPHSG
jgi:UTP--glucose-1-phosphate uridylyltransferase